MSAVSKAIRRRLPSWRDEAPSAFGLNGRRPGTHSVVACVGDSTDHIHLNDRAADVVADLISDVLQERHP